MTPKSFLVTAWCNGQPRNSGSGYGLKISVEDRDGFFCRDWQTVTLRLGNEATNRVAKVNCAKDSFWNGDCRELIGKDIGRWFLDNDFAPWPKRMPPRFRMSLVETGVFDVMPEDV